MRRTTSPASGFGVAYVVLAGSVSPLSATASTSSIEGGARANPATTPGGETVQPRSGGDRLHPTGYAVFAGSEKRPQDEAVQSGGVEPRRHPAPLGGAGQRQRVPGTAEDDRCHTRFWLEASGAPQAHLLQPLSSQPRPRRRRAQPGGMR